MIVAVARASGTCAAYGGYYIAFLAHQRFMVINGQGMQ